MGNTLNSSNIVNYGLGGGNYGCSNTVQGISNGYMDTYSQSLDGMWINLPPGLCNGTYYVVTQVDPYNYFQETNENNNVVAVPITLTQQGGTIPVITAGGTTTFCAGGSVTLTSTGATNYLWTNGATTQSITVNASGSYSVTVNTGSSCSSTSQPIVVTVTSVTVNASAVSTSICTGQNTQLTCTHNASGTSTVPTLFTNNTQVFIPDNNATGVTSPVTVSGISPATLSSGMVVSVKLNLTHTYDGDLIISLISPSGNQINLSNRRGGGGDNFTNTIFSMSAATLIANGTAPFTGSYIPDGSFNSLTGNVNGIWRVKAADVAASDTGRIRNWTLTLNNVVTAPPAFSWISNVRSSRFLI
ncbi:MAG: proprotein convertase P-domain-containing protein [Bacteroidota bacterium]